MLSKTNKRVTDVVITLVAVLTYFSDTIHVLTEELGLRTTMEELGLGGPHGRLSVWGLTRMFGPMLHIPDAGAFDAVWMTALCGGLLTCWATWASRPKVVVLNNLVGIACVFYFVMVLYYVYLVMNDGGTTFGILMFFTTVLAVAYAYRIGVIFKGDLPLYGRLYGAFAAVAAIFMALGMYSMSESYHLVAANIALYGYMHDAFQTYGKWAEGDDFPHNCAPDAMEVKKATEELTLIQYAPAWAVAVTMVAVPAIFAFAAVTLKPKTDRGDPVGADSDLEEELVSVVDESFFEGSDEDLEGL